MFFGETDNPKVARILSIDGGGIRGMIPAVVLAAIEKQAGKPISKLFHLVAGTSTGAVLSLGLTKKSPYTAEEMINLYKQEGPRIFSTSFWRRLKTVNGLLGAYYDEQSWESVLKDTMGDAMFSDCLNDVLVHAYDLEMRMPALFKSWRSRGESGESDDLNSKYPRVDDYRIRDIARGSSAAPTYFEPARIQSVSGKVCTLIDGGVYANNPAALAISTAARLYPNADSYLMVSLGTGQASRAYRYADAKHWGRPQWAMPVIDILSGAVDDTIDYQLGKVLSPEKYFRFQTDLLRRHEKVKAPNDDMDDISADNLERLQGRAELMIEENRERFEELLVALSSSRADRNSLISSD